MFKKRGRLKKREGGGKEGGTEFEKKRREGGSKKGGKKGRGVFLKRRGGLKMEGRVTKKKK